MRSFRSDRRGAALALAVYATVVIGALVAATFFAAWLELKNGENSLAAAQAFAAAEAGIEDLSNSWNSSVFDTMTPGASLALPVVSLIPGVRYTDTLSRLNAEVFLTRATGERFGPGGVLARRTLARFSRLTNPTAVVRAALTTLGPLTVSGQVQVSGADSIPPGWAPWCPPADTALPGVSEPGGLVSTLPNCAMASCVGGNPPLQIDTALKAPTLTRLGDLDFAQLFATADVSVSGTLNGIRPQLSVSPVPGQCDRSDSTNWGEPLVMVPPHPCSTYFPIIAAQGGTTIYGGRGQGTLLANGDLDVAGGFDFQGAVVVAGRLTLSGTGGRFHGGVIVLGAAGGSSSLGGQGLVTYSSCALKRASGGAGRPIPLTERSWVQWY